MISRSHALAGLGYGSLAVALVGLTAIGPTAGTIDRPGSADLTLSRDLASLTAAATDAAALTTEHDRATLAAPQVTPMAELTTEHDVAQLGASETDQAVLEEEHDTATLTWEVVS